MWPDTGARRRGWLAALFLLAAWGAPAGCQTPGPIVYTLRAPDPETQMLEVTASVPTGGSSVIELMMPVWSPGYYRVEDYAGKVTAFEAWSEDGEELTVEHARPNRWRVTTGGSPSISVRYRLLCAQRSVTTNWVSPELAVINGPATFITLADGPDGAHEVRPHEVHVVLPASWPRVMTGLARAPDGERHHYVAESYDELVDAPFVAGALDVHEFDVEGVPHYLVDGGERDAWNGARAARDLKRIVEATLPLWGRLPYDHYVFLNVFRRGGGGLEHANSTLLTANAAQNATERGYKRWLAFVAHEYFHAFNVKRLRPVELGPFDYERGPRTTSLWISEGMTSYFADLFLVRAGLNDPSGFLASMSRAIGQLQASPGRHLQSVAQSSLEVWSNSNSGVGAAETTVSYYVKGQVLGFLLDARIRRLTDGEGSLDDVMRIAYRRYGGARGFTAEEFQEVVEEVAGSDVDAWFESAVRSTDELDYQEALDWFGLRFAEGADWRLEVRPGVSPTERAHFGSLLSPGDTARLPSNP